MKQCSKCKITKDFAFFSKAKSRKDGHSYWCKKCSKEHNASTKEVRSKKFKAYYVLNKSSLSKTRGRYNKARYESDPGFRAMVNIRARVWGFLNGKEKHSKKLGCSSEQLKRHLESKFESGMTWENYGEWHIDHSYPLSKAYEEGQESFSKACHYTNLQPLWAKDNLAKSNSITI